MKSTEFLKEDGEFLDKATVKAKLKELGLCTVYIKTAYQYAKKSYKPNGVAMAGISLGSHSPMDVTSAGRDRVRDYVLKVENALRQLGMTVSRSGPLFATANIGTKKEFSISTYMQDFPTYSRSMDLDSGYVTSWLVFNFAAKRSS